MRLSGKSECQTATRVRPTQEATSRSPRDRSLCVRFRNRSAGPGIPAPGASAAHRKTNLAARLIRGVLCGPAGHGDEAYHGSFDRSPQDRGHRFDHVEEGRAFRSGTTETASSLSAEESRWTIPEVIAEPLAQSRFLEALGFEGEYLLTR